jgi:hypothetical protein
VEQCRLRQPPQEGDLPCPGRLLEPVTAKRLKRFFTRALLQPGQRAGLADEGRSSSNSSPQRSHRYS